MIKVYQLWYVGSGFSHNELHGKLVRQSTSLEALKASAREMWINDGEKGDKGEEWTKEKYGGYVFKGIKKYLPDAIFVMARNLEDICYPTYYITESEVHEEKDPVDFDLGSLDTPAEEEPPKEERPPTVEEAASMLSDALLKQQAYDHWLVSVGSDKETKIMVYLLKGAPMLAVRQQNVRDLARELKIDYRIDFTETGRPTPAGG